MSYYHLNADTTGTLIQPGTTGLVRLIVGKTGSADWTVTIYDAKTSTDAIAANAVSVNNLNAGGQYDYEIPLSRGLYVVASGTTAGDVTIVYE